MNYEQADRPPRRLRFGASYDLLRAFHADTLLALRIATQVETGDPAPRTTAVSVGVELSVARALFMRVGYDGALQLQDSGAAMGIGFAYDRFRLAVAKSFTATSLEPDPAPQLSLGISF